MGAGGRTLRLSCPYLGAFELTEERERHIAARHPELGPGLQAHAAGVVAAPDEVRRSSRRPSARLFSRRQHIAGWAGNVVVVVESSTDSSRHWILIAYFTRKLTGGTVEWQRS